MRIPASLSQFRKRLPLSNEGFGWLILMSGMLLTGLIKNINLITLLGCILLAIGTINAALAWRQIRGLRVQRALPPFLIAARPNRWVVRLRQDSLRARTGLLLDDHAPDGRDVRMVDLAACPDEIVERTIVPSRRGTMRLPPVVVSCGYPFGLIVFERHSGEDEIAIAPPLGVVRRAALRRWLSQRHVSIGAVRSRPIRHPSGQAEFHGLRPFRSGDSPRHVHWRTSARRGELMVREFEEHPNDDLVLIVDLAATDSASPQDFEAMLSLAATIVWEWCRQKGDRLTVILAGAEPRRIHGPTGDSVCGDVLRALAVASPQVGGTSAATIALLDEFPMPGTTHLLLSDAESPLVEALSFRYGRTVVVVDQRRGDERDFFECAPSATAAEAESSS
jgi:uncharacterized protein (DUF58 family)